MPLLFEVRENTLLKAFCYASLVTGISTGIVLEYRRANPFGLYSQSCSSDSSCDGKQALTFKAILHTSIVAFLSTFIVLWVLYFAFGFGRSLVMAEETAGNEG